MGCPRSFHLWSPGLCYTPEAASSFTCSIILESSPRIPKRDSLRSVPIRFPFHWKVDRSGNRSRFVSDVSCRKIGGEEPDLHRMSMGQESCQRRISASTAWSRRLEETSHWCMSEPQRRLRRTRAITSAKDNQTGLNRPRQHRNRQKGPKDWKFTGRSHESRCIPTADPIGVPSPGKCIDPWEELSGTSSSRHGLLRA